MTNYDTIIAGAGPVGLFLACELRLQGLNVLILEQAADPHSPLKQLPFGMRGLWSPALEAFDRRNLLTAIETRLPNATFFGSGAAPAKPGGKKPAGHFAGIQFDLSRIDTTRWTHRLPNAPVAGFATTMQDLETVLAKRAVEMGIEIRRGIAVQTVQQSDEQVTITANGETLHAKYLVGCDGGRSTVRKAAGFHWTGTPPELTGYSVLVDLADPSHLKPGRNYTAHGMYAQQQPGAIVMAHFDSGTYDRTQPLTREHVQTVLRLISGTDVTLTALHQGTTWTDRAFQATHYRRGRVLLCGDAAHIHSPLGGQGLNLGLGDAMNLGWKLAATIQNEAPADLLDTYETERHPIGAAVLDWSRAQIALMQPTPQARALESIVRDLIDTTDGATYFAERVWGTGIQYNLRDNEHTSEAATHPLTGRSAPNFTFADNTTLNEHLRTGKGILLNFQANPALEAFASREITRLHQIAKQAEDNMGLTAALIRPDGVIAWATTNPTPNLEELAAATTRWFGQPL